MISCKLSHFPEAPPPSTVVQRDIQPKPVTWGQAMERFLIYTLSTFMELLWGTSHLHGLQSKPSSFIQQFVFWSYLFCFHQKS